jgi:hypothetical protein
VGSFAEGKPRHAGKLPDVTRLRGRDVAPAHDIIMFILSRHIRACVDQGALVFLDLRRDKYLSIDASRAPAIANVWPAGIGDLGPALIGRGLIEPAADVAASATPPPCSQLVGDLDPDAFRYAATDRRDALLASYACTRASIAVRARRLDKTFEALAASKAGKSRSRIATEDAVARFEKLRPWYPRSRVCLFDSIALMHFLLGHGRSPRLVMGVRANPFSAHCWLEENDICLNDAAETCRSYTPIAAV